MIYLINKSIYYSDGVRKWSVTSPIFSLWAPAEPTKGKLKQT